MPTGILSQNLHRGLLSSRGGILSDDSIDAKLAREMTHNSFHPPEQLGMAQAMIDMAAQEAMPAYGFARGGQDMMESLGKGDLGWAALAGLGMLPGIPAITRKSKNVLESLDGLKFKPHPYSNKSETTIFVDPLKIDDSWARDRQGYLPKSGRGSSEVEGRRGAVEDFIQTGDPIDASKAELSDGDVRFSDGRHRFAVLRDRGAREVALTVPRKQRLEFVKRFGSSVEE